MQWFHHRGVKPTAVCCLYATAPFVEPSDLKNGLNLLHHAADDRFVFTATSYASPIQRSLLIDPLTGLARMQLPEKFTIRSQDLEPYFHDAGQFYWGRPKAWLSSENLFESSKPLLLPRWRVQDIDTLEDWTMAEHIFKARLFSLLILCLNLKL